MSTFADAIMNNMIASMDPQLHMQRDAMQGFLANQRLGLNLEKAKTIKSVGKLLNEAIKNNEDPSIVQAYKEILESLRK